VQTQNSTNPNFQWVGGYASDVRDRVYHT